MTYRTFCQKFLDTVSQFNLFYFGFLGLLIISFWKWSIVPFFQQISSLPHTLVRRYSLDDNRIFPADIFNFSKKIISQSSGRDSFILVTKKGEGEKDYFTLVYLLFPRKIYWVSDAPVGPISWWIHSSLIPQDILTFAKEKNSSNIISLNNENLLDPTDFKEMFHQNKYSLYHL